MRERVTKSISVLFITISYLVALFPFYVVLADSYTYTIIEPSTCYSFRRSSDSRYVKLKFNNSGRGVIVQNGTSYTVAFVFNTPTNYTNESVDYNSSCTVDTYTLSLNGIVNHSGYYGTSYSMYNVSDLDFPIVQRGSFTSTMECAYQYTYGEYAVDPEPEITYGDLIIDGYSTDIAGQGEASINNIDHILWNGFIDTNGNDISDLEVRLQIVPGTYTSDSKAHLLEQTYEDLIININSAHEQVYDASLGEVSFKWSDIVDMLNITPYKLWSLQLFGVDWQKEGWIYRIRLEDSENEYVGNWQTIYSSTSSGVENDLTIINSTSIDQTFITALQEVNNLNTVTNNWTVNNTEISVNNNYTEPSSGEKPWWAYLLESILNTFNITNNYIYEGDSNTQNITNTVNDSDDDMNRKIGEYQQFEDTFIDDMDSNLTDIDTNIDFLSDNKFIASANWVAQQYNRMTTNNVIGSFIGFSLLFGLALIFIGKIH